HVVRQLFTARGPHRVRTQEVALELQRPAGGLAKAVVEEKVLLRRGVGRDPPQQRKQPTPLRKNLRESHDLPQPSNGDRLQRRLSGAQDTRKHPANEGENTLSDRRVAGEGLSQLPRDRRARFRTPWTVGA